VTAKAKHANDTVKKVKVKQRTAPEGFRRMRLSYFKTIGT